MKIAGSFIFALENVEFEAFSMGGIIRDFELLKKAGVIKQVEKKQYTNYLVY